MCGICGIVHLDRQRPIDEYVLSAMRDVLAYRGPDGAGIHIDGHVGLAHRRLSIIDLASGHQPMCNEDRSIWIVFNGEIYNYVELRKQYLEGRHQFSSTSDTEVIIHLYEEFGARCVDHLNGMFAFALWDARQQTLLLARDRVGVKPLYYAIDRNALIFASEIKSLLRYPGVSPAVDPYAIDQYMTYGYVQSPGTALKGIYRVPEGQVMTYAGGRLTSTRYWDLDFTPTVGVSEEEHIAQVSRLLDESIRLRLRSDVPIGVLLSGGFDSSAVTGLLAQRVGRVKTFSIGFEGGADYNELDWARRVAAFFGTEHHEVVLKPEAFRDFIPQLAYYMDEPVTEAPAVPLYFVCRLASQQVKVVLSGEGADELFAGYPIYRYMQLLERYRLIPELARRLVTDPLLRCLKPGPKLQKYLALARAPLNRRYLNVHLYDMRERQRIYTPDFAAQLRSIDPLDSIRGVYEHTRDWDLLSRLLYLDTTTWLGNDILIKADRMSMANSIELRVPFLDYRLIEYAARIPSRYKLRGAEGKYILKRALRRVVPDVIRKREKMGFPTPLARMFRSELSGYIREVLLDSQTIRRGYFAPNVVRTLIEEHRSGSVDRHSELWRLLMLEHWHRQMVDLPLAA
jgi:asparagine synthase (glutamine-hydrolysing)